MKRLPLKNDTWTVAESRSFVYDGWNMVQEFSTLNSQLSILNSYVWGLDLSGSLQGAGGVGGLIGQSSHLGYTSSIDLGSHGANYGLGIPVVEVGVSVSVRLICLAFPGKDDNGCPCEDSKPVTVVGLLSN